MNSQSKFLACVATLSVLALTLSACSASSTSDDGQANLADVSNLQSESAAASPAGARPAVLLSDWLVGSWVQAPKGGEDGQTNCGDFNAPALYKLNGNTGTIVTFRSDGQYRSMFAYTTPSGAEHTTLYKARWALNGSTVALTDLSAQDAFKTDGGSGSLGIGRQSANVLMLEGGNGAAAARYVRCVGSPDDIYGEGGPSPEATEPGPQTVPDAPVIANANPTCKSLEPDIAKLTAARTRRNVIEVDAGDQLVDGSMSCTAVIITDAGNLYVRYGIEKTPQGRPIIRAIWSESPVI